MSKKSPVVHVYYATLPSKTLASSLSQHLISSLQNTRIQDTRERRGALREPQIFSFMAVSLRFVHPAARGVNHLSEKSIKSVI